MSKKETILKDRECMICGKKFDVEFEPGNKVPNKYWFNKTLIKELTGGKDDSEYWECEECSGFKDDLIIKEKVKTWMENYWGSRCEDYVGECEVCRAWKYYDYIFKDVDTEESN